MQNSKRDLEKEDFDDRTKHNNPNSKDKTNSNENYYDKPSKNKTDLNREKIDDPKTTENNDKPLITKNNNEPLVTKKADGSVDKKKAAKPVVVKKPEEPQLTKEESEALRIKKTIRQYHAIDIMRKRRNSFQDFHGVGKLIPRDAEINTRAYNWLVDSFLRTSNPNDKQTEHAMSRLLSEPGGITVEKYTKKSLSEIEAQMCDLIDYKRKAKCIKMAAIKIKYELEGKVPDTIDGLMKLKGVDKKIAVDVMQGAYRKTTGIPVHPHLQRIANMLKWTDETDADKTMVALQKIFPKD